MQDIIQTGISHSDRIARQQLAQELKNMLASKLAEHIVLV